MELVLNGKRYELDEEQEKEFEGVFEQRFGEENRLTNVSDSKKESLMDELGFEPVDDDKLGY